MGLDMYLRKNDVQICYWRKANHIHAWLVDNIQAGEDDCEVYPITLDEIKTLLELCQEVKECPEKAPKLLPASTGFFFGSTDYDEWYFENIDLTIQQFTDLINNADPDAAYEYQSSW